MSRDNKDCESVRERELMRKFAEKYHDVLEKAVTQHKSTSDAGIMNNSSRSKKYRDRLVKKKNRTGWKVAYVMFAIVVLSSGLTIWVNSTPAQMPQDSICKKFFLI